MLMKPEPLAKAIGEAKKALPGSKTVLLSPQGRTFNKDVARELSSESALLLVCGRYEGVDQRFIDLEVDVEVSIGDYILTGGEIPAMVILDGVARLLPGVVGRKESLKSESFEDGLLDWPQYTRPTTFRGAEIPPVLKSGNHREIKKWREKMSLEITKKRRPDLFDKRT